MLAGLPMPRHSEGGIVASMFANVRREMWPMHARDLLYQRYHYAQSLIIYEQLARTGRLRTLGDIERDATAKIGAGGGTALEQALAWLQAADEVHAAMLGAQTTLAARYALRNVAVTLALAALLVSLVLYVLHVMTFADPFFVLFYRRYARRRRVPFWMVPDTIAMAWASGVVGAYYFVTLTVYLALLQGQWRYSAFDASHVHDTFSERRYLISAMVPGLISQWALTRSFTIYYRTPFVPPPAQSSMLLTLLRWLIKLRLIFSAQVQSREVAKVYLIRLYVAALSIVAVVLIFLASASVSFPLPYMYQPKHIDVITWDARFQTLTYKIISLPLLLGAAYNLHLWGGTKLTVDEVDALYRLKRTKEARLLGITDREEEEALIAQRAAEARLAKANGGVLVSSSSGDGSGAGGSAQYGVLDGVMARAALVDAEPSDKSEEAAALRTLVKRKQAGRLTVEGLQELEQLQLRTRTYTTLMQEKLEESRRRLDRQMGERQEALQAVRSSKAFLGRGFRDIEMLLEAGFRELEDQRSSFMANRRKKLHQRIERDRARRAQRTAGSGPAGVGSPGGDDGGGGDEDGDGGGSDSDSDESGESLASFNSEALASMDFDELQARLAANEAKDRKLGGRKVDEAKAEAEAADIRRTEYASLAASKMGKQQQLDELSSRVAKEQAAAAAMRERLEAAMADEQTHLEEWEKADAALQEAELERANVVAQKAKAKELALEKAQVAEASLEELKERYRELRRREEKMLRAVREAEASGREQSQTLDLKAEALQREQAMWMERIAAAEADRQALFGEAQHVEQRMRDEKARKVEAQGEAARYRDILRKEM